MIDTWLFAALCFGLLALCALLRVIPGPERNDRIVSFTAAITLFAAAALVLSIASGNLFILDAAIVIALLLFAGTFSYAKFCGGE
ncbi:MAG: monovalent cation/H+ antiporter complex subunit F [Methanoregula sp.]|nr:monovalent cation/H+ antiporter complex subunit F [Methanoregula sp.]MDP2797754.1 monovalent cation/H+ antiporter complex subunit F [Methanoregula sp.]